MNNLNYFLISNNNKTFKIIKLTINNNKTIKFNNNNKTIKFNNNNH